VGWQNGKAEGMFKKVGLILFCIFCASCPAISEQKTIGITPGEINEDIGYGTPDGFKIYRAATAGINPSDPSTYINVVEIPYVGQVEHFQDVIACNRQLYFGITAYNAAGESALLPSNIIGHFFEQCPPQPPLIYWQALMSMMKLIR
jgi:hypothetical protein